MQQNADRILQRVTHHRAIPPSEYRAVLESFEFTERLPDNSGMSERECGSCTACCEGWLKSKETGMFPGHPCQFSTRKGCAIYASRPHYPCRTFSCGWLKENSPLPDEMRPDKSGVIVIVGRKWKDWDVIRAISAGSGIPEASLQWIKNHAMQTKTPLLIVEYLEKDGKIIGESKQGFGPPEFSIAVQNSFESDNSPD